MWFDKQAKYYQAELFEHQYLTDRDWPVAALVGFVAVLNVQGFDVLFHGHVDKDEYVADH